jgi:hypothetical protein
VSAEGGEAASTEAAAAVPRAPGENTLRLRTRPPRRRRRPTVAATTAETGASGEAGVPAADATPTPPGPRLGPDGQPLRRRRRRRRPPQLGGAADSTAGAHPTADAATPPPSPNRRPPRHRNRGPRTDRPAVEAGAGASQDARPEGSRRSTNGRGPRQGDGPRDGDRRREGPSSRPEGDRRPRDASRDRRDGREGRGRGRGDAPKRVERKLYTLDAIVDRGFEDVEEEAGTRRIHWTIVKRTVADQITRKPTSQSYVLQRDGVDSEFPGLGAARDAVHKKIVHPEKLTLSKAEHTAQKSGR